MIREQLFVNKKAYRKLLKQKKNKFKENILEKQYWDLVKQLKDQNDNKSDPADNLKPQELAQYF